MSFLRAFPVVCLLWACAPTAEHLSPTRELPPPTTTSAPAPLAESGPLPDFSPLASVHTHLNLDQIAPDLQRLLSRIAGPRHVIEDTATDDDTIVWMRDHQPIYVRRADGSLKVVAYLSENAVRSESTTHDRSRDAQLGLADEVLPLLHENGNLVTNGRLVFVSERIFEDNSAAQSDDLLVKAGYSPRDGDQVVTLLAKALERPVDDIIIVPRMPGEATGHVDVWMLFVDEHTVVIPEVRPEAQARTETVDDHQLSEEVALFLDTEAGHLRDFGLEVVRLPMIAPITVPALNEPAASGLYDTLFVSPANALLLMTDERADIILPSVDVETLLPPVKDLEARYEDEWSEFFDAHGWTPWYTEATELVQYLGLVRCVTAPVPYR